MGPPVKDIDLAFIAPVDFFLAYTSGML